MVAVSYWRAQDQDPGLTTEIVLVLTARPRLSLVFPPLAALLFEGFLSRFFSHASLERAGRSVGIVATVGRVRPRGGALAKPADDERVPVGGGR
jgi:hypothetical protein